jgi:YesN/AraC family two-component response regulator
MKQHTVLIADDRVQARNGLRALLSTIPNVIVIGEAKNGQEAVQLAEIYQPDVILMDVKMPEMNGLEATMRIKTQCPKIRIVILTVYAAFRKEALEVGADSFLVKGCPDEMLMEAIIGQTE